MIRYALAILLVTGPAQALAEDSATGLALWGKIHEVFSHPRCANCHVGGDNVPMWSGAAYGPAARPHGINIIAGDTRDGAKFLACSTCHTLHNSDTPHGPPGAEDWQLPASERQWFGRSSAEICAQFRDPTLRNIKSIGDVVDHIKKDGRVKWAWDPGPGRKPPPYSVDELAAFVAQWDAAGSPCPDR